MKTRHIIVALVAVLLLLSGIAYLFNQYTHVRTESESLATTTGSASPIGESIAVGHVSAVTGTAQAVTSSGEIRPLNKTGPVFLNETIRTETDSGLQITLNDGSMLNQGENSSILIDAFVYDPEIAGRNKCHVTVLGGIFRTVTDGITRLNPDHFKVKTRMATIGIRGCEVGVDMTGDESEDVFIIGLPAGHTIRVETDKAVETDAYSITPNKI